MTSAPKRERCVFMVEAIVMLVVVELLVYIRLKKAAQRSTN